MYLTAKYLWKTLPNKLRGKSMTHTISKQELFVALVTTVNYCHKEIYYWYYRASETRYYKNLKMRNCKIFFGAQFSWGAFFRGAIFPGAFFRTPCHLQNWLQKFSLAEIVTVRDRFSYNKEIEWMSKDQVLRQNSFSITYITQWWNSTVHCVSELYCILIIPISLSWCILQTK